MLLSSILSFVIAQARPPPAPHETLNTADVIRIRASTDENQATFVQWEGEVFIYQQGQRPVPAFNVLGMNVARAKKLKDGGYDLLTRELQLYLDPSTNKPLHFWTNPFTNDSVNVIHVQNSPVYQTISNTTAETPRTLPNDHATFTLNIPLAYPNPLNPTNSPTSPFKPYQGAFQPLYSAIESFTFTFSSPELRDRKKESVSSTQIYWTRTSPLLPWMKSPDTNATLLFVANGAKVARGFDGLNPVLKDVIRRKVPMYMDAPRDRVRAGGGVTSWSFFTKPEAFQVWKKGVEFPTAVSED